MENSRELSVAVIGLGFIGLPLALSYAMHGANVVGIDVLPKLIEEINEGKSHHLEYYNGQSISEIMKEQLDAGRFRATADYTEAAAMVDTYVITVGVPVHNGEANFNFLQSCCEQLATVLKTGDLVILRSTVVPGTTEELVLPILESTGLKAGVDFYLAYSSERIAEGKAFEEFITMPLAVGGINVESAEKAQAVLSYVTQAEILITDIKVVETAKVVENIQRDVNIAMVQQFARFAEKMNIDTFELIKVANSHKRVNLLIPGPGVGGYCVPNALYYLQPKARELGVSIELLETARQINDSVPQLLVDMLERELLKKGKSLNGSKIALLGLAMKDFSDDDRISPPHQIAQILIQSGAIVQAYDPAVSNTYSYKVEFLGDAVNEADALVYLTVQEAFLELDWNSVVLSMVKDPVLLDIKNRIPKSIPTDATLIRI
ncbi:MAG TPA: nucleotide sugar dehydrogenase [Bacilli bacterium]